MAPDLAVLKTSHLTGAKGTDILVRRLQETLEYLASLNQNLSEAHKSAILSLGPFLAASKYTKHKDTVRAISLS